jgi:hypothetical protein
VHLNHMCSIVELNPLLTAARLSRKSFSSWAASASSLICSTNVRTHPATNNARPALATARIHFTASQGLNDFPKKWPMAFTASCASVPEYWFSLKSPPRLPDLGVNEFRTKNSPSCDEVPEAFLSL